MKRLTIVACSLLGLCLQSICSAPAVADDNDIQARLAKMPRPWSEAVHRITLDEYEETLSFWGEQYPELLTVERRGVSAQGMRIYLLKITDSTVADEDKQVCLISSLHGGPERSGTTTILHLVEWLLSNDPGAAEVRRKQVVLLMPVNNPESFFVTDRFGNAQGIDPYTGGGPKNWDLKTMTYLAADKAPEVTTFLSVVDEYQPDVHADVHGTGLQEYSADQLGDRQRYRGQTMFEVTGSAYSNYALRPWDWRVTESIIAAGRKAGFGSDRFEADAQRQFGGPAMQPISGKTWSGSPNFYTAQYAYAKYHTMVMAFEVGWEASGVARLQGLLDIGNHVWEGAGHAGYPVDRVRNFVGHFVVAYGQDANTRRESRIELWNQQARFSQAILYPQTDGRDTYIVAVDQQARNILDADRDKFLKNLEGLPAVQPAAIRAFVEAGPEIKLAVSQGQKHASDEPTIIKHGLSLRLRLPYRQPELLDVRLNGQLLKSNKADGYESWFANGFTQLQINIPPQKSRATGLYVVTCAYKPDEERSNGWTPPQAVLDRLKARDK